MGCRLGICGSHSSTVDCLLDSRRATTLTRDDEATIKKKKSKKSMVRGRLRGEL